MILTSVIERIRTGDFSGIVDYLGWLPGFDCVWLEGALDTVVLMPDEHCHDLTRVLNDLLRTDQIYRYTLRKMRIDDVQPFILDDRLHDDVRLFLDRQVGIRDRVWVVEKREALYCLIRPALAGEVRQYKNREIGRGAQGFVPNRMLAIPGRDFPIEQVNLSKLEYLPGPEDV